MANNCKFSDVIYMYFNKELNSEKQTELLEHIKSCKECNEEFQVVSVVKKELEDINELELPKDYKQKLHEKLLKTVNTAKTFKFENYTKVINRFVPAAAAVVIIAVIAQGAYLYKSNFNSPDGLAQLNNKAAGDYTNQKAIFDECTENDELAVPNLNMKSFQVRENVKNAEKQKSTESMNDSGLKIKKTDGTQGVKTQKDYTDSKTGTAYNKEENYTIQSREVNQIGSELSSPPDKNSNTDTKASISAIPEDEKEAGFKTIDKGNCSGYHEKNNYVVRDNEVLNRLWSKMYENREPKPDLPEIDFNKDMIIAVFAGQKNTGGYSIQIDKVVETEKTLEVYVQEKAPEAGSMVTQALTAPYHIIQLPKIEKEVLFK